VLGWSPMSLKQPDTGKTYSNLIEANRASWRDAIIPFLELLSMQLTRLVRTLPTGYDGAIAQPDSMLTVRFDTSQIEELAADTKALSDRAVALYQSGLLSLNEARQIMGYAEIESQDTPAEAAEDEAE